jgi:hypothetical protein
VRCKKSEQLRISVDVGRRFAPVTDLGLQSAALVMKISERARPAEARKWSKFFPD